MSSVGNIGGSSGPPGGGSRKRGKKGDDSKQNPKRADGDGTSSEGQLADNDSESGSGDRHRRTRRPRRSALPPRESPEPESEDSTFEREERRTRSTGAPIAGFDATGTFTANAGNTLGRPDREVRLGFGNLLSGFRPSPLRYDAGLDDSAGNAQNVYTDQVNSTDHEGPLPDDSTRNISPEPPGSHYTSPDENAIGAPLRPMYPVPYYGQGPGIPVGPGLSQVAEAMRIRDNLPARGSGGQGSETDETWLRPRPVPRVPSVLRRPRAPPLPLPTASESSHGPGRSERPMQGNASVSADSQTNEPARPESRDGESSERTGNGSSRKAKGKGGPKVKGNKDAGGNPKKPDDGASGSRPGKRVV